MIPAKNPTETEIRQALRMKEFKQNLQQESERDRKLYDLKIKEMREQFQKHEDE